MINVGIIGAGFIVPSFIKAVEAVKGFKLIGVSSPNEAHAKKIKEDYGLKYFTTDNDVVLSDPKIDVIYIAVPNGLHYEIGLKALNNGKHVIMEKPFTPSYREAKKLINLAKEKDLIIFDAVTMLHMPNYKKMCEVKDTIGDIKMIDINFSQYSSRYDKFRNGIVLPAFDKKLAGGALMDLGIYNINFVVGMFGRPKKVAYYPNMKKGVDTSGVLVLDYGKFKVNAVDAKDCKAPLFVCIQGDKGYIRCDDASSLIRKFEVTANDGSKKEYALNKYTDIPHYYEYREFKRLINQKDLEKAQEYNKLTLETIRVLEKALQSADINFN